MDPARAQQVLDDYNQTLNSLSTRMAPSEAKVQAATLIVNAVRRLATERRRVAGLQAATAAANRDRLLNHPQGPNAAILDIINAPGGARGATLVGQYEAIRREYRRQLTRFTRKHRASLIGTRRNKAALQNVTDEVFGRNTGDPEARAFARAWQDVSEQARLRFNAAGGRIPRRADWGMPQSHDARAIARAGYTTWRDFLLERLDLGRMTDETTGLPFTAESLEVQFGGAYNAILSDGWSRRNAVGHGPGRRAYDRHLDHRFFIFRDATAWREYQAKFGDGDPFRVMLGHLDHMARETAEMEILGPSPVEGFEYLKQLTIQHAARTEGPAGIERAVGATRAAQNVMDMFNGVAQQPGSRRFAQAASATRQWLASSQLGAAFVSSITDFNTSRIAAQFVGMSATAPVRTFARLLASPELRAQAAEAGLILENAVDLGHAVGRYTFEDFHIEGARRLADFTIRASGLGIATEISRQAFGLEFMRLIARNAAIPFRDLDRRFRRALDHYGISERDWSLIAGVRPHDAGGLTIVRPTDIAAAGHPAVADRVMEMIVDSLEHAVPTNSVRARAAVLGSSRPGTIAGELVRGLAQFKAFPITLLTQQFRRVSDLARTEGAFGVMRYAADFFVTMTLFGAVALQLKEISKGKDPRPMDSVKFWQAAAAQGGGLGLLGDFFFADFNRFGQNPWEQLAGPQASFLADVGKLTLGNAQQAIRGEELELSNELLNFANRYTPGGSLWYARLAYEREILDQIRKATDPKAYRRFKAKERAARDFDTQFYYRPGASILQGDRVRAPDFGNALGDRR